ncbi:hypothetical protein NCC78_17195 [Micromonospora phytophila]|uniref:CG0192-related protein n=1 Tax=Micromonospora phytophila TaxID=709888 RepID=UPI00202E9213|nr:hypothetical protein [Micromonospora phytophila]MCM0676409.1 hypothetical protein [Micromonospora phytophila]
MALLHRAKLHPTKLELLAAWLPGRPWYRGEATADVVSLAAYRFDDPAGEVGIETIVVGVGAGAGAGAGPVHQVPLTYRGAPLDGADDWLVGTTDHSVLGRRWVYDGCADPVYAAALTGAIFGRAGQAEEFFEVDGELQRREPSLIVTAGGVGDTAPAVGALRRVVEDDGTLIVTDSVELTVVRRPAAGTTDGGTGPADAMLTGTWPGQPAPLPLAYARLR